MMLINSSPVPARIVELVLVTSAGTMLGRLEPFPVATPWWPEARPVVVAARQLYGIDVVVLRILRAERDSPPGGAVTYLAEVAEVPLGNVGLQPWPYDLDDHPLRMAWARPGGPGADLAWADTLLAERGLVRSGPAEQIRTWNLSSLWRLPVHGGAVWLKHVPPFFAHEAAIIDRLASPAVPELIAADGSRSLMHDIQGQDMYDAGVDVLSRGVSMLTDLQHALAGRVDELLGLGLPDWRAPALTARIAAVVERTASELSDADRAALDEFIAGLPRRFHRLAECGIADTLVHGDFSPGNLRGDGRSLVLLDWGDSGVGHPLLDQPAMLSRAPAEAVEALRDRWVTQWMTAVPGSDPARAARLLAPVAAARQAVIYGTFLDNIEPSEHPYHRADPSAWLARAAHLVRVEAQDAASQ